MSTAYPISCLTLKSREDTFHERSLTLRELEINIRNFPDYLAL